MSSEYKGLDASVAGLTDEGLDSPTIGGKESLGGMIHHLRNTSDQSSIFTAMPAHSGIPSFIGRGSRILDHDLDLALAGPNAWDLDELENYYGETIGGTGRSQQDSAPTKGQPLAPANSKANIYVSRPSTRDSDVMDGSGGWQNAFKKQHTRDTSTATQAERQAFDDELAARQRAIQEKMKNVVDGDSRGTSPAPSAAGALKAFGMLRAKPSREAMSRDTSSKPAKMLGMSQGGQQDKYSIYEDAEGNNSRIVAHGNAWAAGPTNGQWPLGGPSQPENANVAGGDTNAGEARGASGRSQLQHPANRARSRSRSGSVASRTRSRSRTGRQRDEVTAPPPDMPQVPGTRRPSVDTSFSSGESQGRKRSNSKASGYFDRVLHPTHSGTPNSRMGAGGVSPASTSPAGYSSTSSTPRPSYSTATSSSTVTKSGSPALSAVHIPVSRPVGSLLRKKTINKADIGEPKLISSTSNVDTVDLSTARTIVQPPLVPSLNPMRRVMTQSERGSGEGSRNAFSPPAIQQSATFPLRPSEKWDDRGSQRSYPRTVRSQESIDTQATRFDAIGSPVMNEAGMF